jgi:hypothetical protein
MKMVYYFLEDAEIKTPFHETVALYNGKRHSCVGILVMDAKPEDYYYFLPYNISALSKKETEICNYIFVSLAKLTKE